MSFILAWLALKQQIRSQVLLESLHRQYLKTRKGIAFIAIVISITKRNGLNNTSNLTVNLQAGFGQAETGGTRIRFESNVSTFVK